MRYTITQRLVHKEGKHVEYLRYYLDGENEDKVLTLFKKEILPPHLEAGGPYEKFVCWGAPSIREYAESDLYTKQIELEREEGKTIHHHYHECTGININRAVVMQIVTAVLAVIAAFSGIVGLFR